MKLWIFLKTQVAIIGSGPAQGYCLGNFYIKLASIILLLRQRSAELWLHGFVQEF